MQLNAPQHVREDAAVPEFRSFALGCHRAGGRYNAEAPRAVLLSVRNWLVGLPTFAGDKAEKNP
jgi:hypothetical protein